MNFGEKLRDLRIKRGWSQTQLAKGLGFRQTTISSWETNVSEPDFQTIKKIADYFHVPPKSLLPFDSETPEEEIKAIAETISKNYRLKVLFDRTATMTDRDLDAILTVARAISREKGEND